MAWLQTRLGVSHWVCYHYSHIIYQHIYIIIAVPMYHNNKETRFFVIIIVHLVLQLGGLCCEGNASEIFSDANVFY